MRIPIPNRISTKAAVLYTAIVFAGQIIEGTDAFFAVLVAVYTALWVLAFNTAGGIEYPSGGFILSNGLYAVVIPFGAKVLLGEAGQRNMNAPIPTMLVYCLGMLMICLVTFVVRALRPKQALLKGFDSPKVMYQGAILCLFFGFALIVVGSVGQLSGGSIWSALRQISGVSYLTIILATSYEIQRTNGRRSINWVTGTNLALGVIFTFVYFGKTAILLGFLTWVVTCMFQGYDFKKGQLALLAVGAFVMFYYIVPYSQFVRNKKSDTNSFIDNLPVAIEYATHLGETRRAYYESLADIDVKNEAHLYDERQGFLDRLIVTAADDELIAYTAEGHTFGLLPTVIAYSNAVPRIIWRNKPSLNIGNAYAHELGNIVADEDETTGIEFSASADAYHQESWLGIMTLLPLGLFLCFLLFDSIAGSAKKSPFGILSVTTLFLIGGSGGLGGVVHAAIFEIFSLLVIAWVAKNLAPLVMDFFGRRIAPKIQIRMLRPSAASGHSPPPVETP